MPREKIWRQDGPPTTSGADHGETVVVYAEDEVATEGDNTLVIGHAATILYVRGFIPIVRRKGEKPRVGEFVDGETQREFDRAKRDGNMMLRKQRPGKK